MFDQPNESLFETVPCTICGGASFDVLKPAKYPPGVTAGELLNMYSASSSHILLDQVVKCRDCSHVFVNPRPKSDLVEQGYADAEDPLFVAQNPSRILAFKQELQQVLKKLNYNPEGRKLLDVGCAGGAFPVAARELGFTVTGVEPSRWLANYAKTTYNLDVRNGMLVEGLFEPASFDVITLWDVIEHMSAPLDALRLIRKLLRPGGLLLVNYPDIDTWVAKALGDRWPYWLSVHLDYYTPATLTRQLANAGFIARSYTPSWKTLPFGYVAQRAEPYVGPFKPLLKLVDALGLSNVNLPHFVGQTLAVCEAVGTGFDTRAKQTAEPTPSERRSDTRVKAEQELTVRNLANDTVQVCILHDLSGSGLRATVTEEIPAGTSVRIEGPDVLLLGEVVRCTAENENFTLGVKLQHTLNGLKALQDWAQAYRDEAQALREESLPR